MKRLFTLLFSLGLVARVSAQGLQLWNIGGYDEDYIPIIGSEIKAVDKDTVFIKTVGGFSGDEITESFFLNNPTNTSIVNLCIKSTREVLPPGVLETVCYGTCYQPDDVQERVVETNATLAAGKYSDISFHSKQSLNEMTRVKYEIYPKDMPTQITTFYVVYGTSTSASVAIEKAKEALYLTHEGNATAFHWNLEDGDDPMLKVVSMTGQMVYEKNLTSKSGALILPENLIKGTYLAVLYLRGKTIGVKKFVIK